MGRDIPVRNCRRVEIRAYADCIELRRNGRSVREHRRLCGHGKPIQDPWQCAPFLARKPSDLSHVASFKGRVLPGGVEQIRRKFIRQSLPVFCVCRLSGNRSNHYLSCAEITVR